LPSFPSTHDDQAEPGSPAGRVYLVGAGPGDPGLITARGLELVRRADVLVYDALADRSLVAEAPAACERIDAGKRARRHRLSQSQIHQVLIARARLGLTVVRLKGGDPYLFGRGAEEMEAMFEAGVACEVTPGVSAGVAAPAYAGIPVTHREHASSVTFITGHEDPTKGETALDYRALAALARQGGTLCFYMGVGRLGAIVDALTGHGLDPATPAAAVQWGTTAKQRVARSSLDSLAGAVEREGLAAPAIIVIGPVAGLDSEPLNFFTRRPLFGQRVAITRTRQQSSALRARLAELGADVIEAPTITLDPPQTWDEVDRTLSQLQRFDWIVLTSVNGVATLADRFDALGLDARALAPVRVAAIGDATADALRQRLAINPDLVPTRFVAESLAADLMAREPIAGKNILLLRADIARPALPQTLRKAGAEVVECVAYRTRLIDEPPEALLNALDRRELDWITFTSSSTVENTLTLLGNRAEQLRDVRTASIGPITSQTLRRHGFEPTVEAGRHDIPGLVEALVRAAAD